MKLKKHALSIDGFIGRYVDIGNGPTIVLVASMLVRIRSYQWTLQQLVRHFRVIAIEMPGCASGSRLRHPWSFSQYANWLAEFLQLKNLNDITLIGHSNSAPVVLEAASLLPDLVSRLFIVDVVGATPGESIPRILIGRAIDALLELKLTLTGFHHVLWNMITHTRNQLNQIWLASHCDIRVYLQDVHQPVLIGWGKHDYTTPLASAHAILTALPHAELYISQTGSHDWIVDHPREFTDVLARWLRSSQPAPSAITTRPHLPI